jgi:hypothetical protein
MTTKDKIIAVLTMPSAWIAAIIGFALGQFVRLIFHL